MFCIWLQKQCSTPKHHCPCLSESPFYFSGLFIFLRVPLCPRYMNWLFYPYFINMYFSTFWFVINLVLFMFISRPIPKICDLVIVSFRTFDPDCQISGQYCLKNIGCSSSAHLLILTQY